MIENEMQPSSEFEFSERLMRLRIPQPRTAIETLRESILARGVLTPLLVACIEDKRVLVDGYTRWAICQEHEVEVPIKVIDLQSDEEAEELFVQLQIGQRNLSDLGRSYLRGSVYLAQKRQGKALAFRQIGEKLTTAERLAKEFGTSARQIERDAIICRDLDRIAEKVGSDVRQEICTGFIKVRRRDIADLAQLGEAELAARINDLRAGRDTNDVVVAPRANASSGEGRTCISKSMEGDLEHRDLDTDGSLLDDGDSEELEVDDDRVQTDGRDASADDGNARPDHPCIFQDGEDLLAAVDNLDQAYELLHAVLNGWKFEPGHDVEPVEDVLQGVIERIADIRETVEWDLVPRETCPSCKGDGCDGCLDWGWFNRRDLEGESAEIEAIGDGEDETAQIDGDDEDFLDSVASDQSGPEHETQWEPVEETEEFLPHHSALA